MGYSTHTGHATSNWMKLLLVMSVFIAPTAMAASILVTTTTTTNVYDSYGNPTSITVAVENDGEEYDGQGNPIPVTYTYTTYTDNTYTNNTTDWHLGRLTRAEVTQYLPDNADAKDGTCTAATPSTCDTRVSAFAYDATTGLLTQEVIEPDTAALTLTTGYIYDAFGNKTDVTVTGGTGATAIASRTTTSNYDARGQFATSTTNALGHSETRTYDAAFGVMLTLEGPNQLTTTWEYDSFGRQTKEIRADGTSTTVTRQWCNGFQGETGHTNCPSGGVLALTTETNGAPITVTFSDALGRVIQTETESFDGTDTILLDTVYDALGRIDKKSRPYFFPSTPAAEIQWHEFEYDVVGRVKKELAPGENNTVIKTESSYAGLQTSIINDLGQINARYKNARGEIISVIENGNTTGSTATIYEYDPFGNLTYVEDPNDNPTSNVYDIRGRKIEMNDPDMGLWFYEYNALGELVKQTDAKGQVVYMEYDKLGRMITRYDNYTYDSNNQTHNGDITTWDYDTVDTYANGQLAHSIGKLISVSSFEGKDESYTYDQYGRLDSTTSVIDNDPYTVQQAYDSSGRSSKVTYPAITVDEIDSSLIVYNEYTSTGYLEKVSNFDTYEDYWVAKEQNAEGQLTEYEFGNGVVTYQKYVAETGRIESIKTNNDSVLGGSHNIQDLSFTFDTIGNLTQRQDLNPSNKNDYLNYGTALTEKFKYDALNRLTESTLDNWATSKVNSYHANGNIDIKAGLGIYTYGELHTECTGGALPGPHAVTTVSGKKYCYDANGNMTKGWNFTDSSSPVERTFTWTSYNKPATIVQGGTTLSFSYGADRSRFKQENTINSTTKTTHYIGGLYEKEELTGGAATHTHYISAGGSTIAVFKKEVDASETSVTSETLRYMHRDHIGSVTAITDGTTALLVEEFSYDAWGKRREESDWTNVNFQITTLETVRGFTNHEMLDDVGLIHMNGRVYDPDLGRFISADPYIQEPLNGQSLNRYSYVLNNPLSFTDPSGYFFSSIFKAIKSIVKSIVKSIKGVVKAANKVVNKITGGNQILNGIIAAAAGYYVGGLAYNASLGSTLSAVSAGSITVETAFTIASITQGAVGGFVAGAIMGGDLKSAGVGLFTGAAFGGISSTVNNLGLKAIAHGTVGGVSNELQGGEFGKGFLSAGSRTAIIGFSAQNIGTLRKSVDFSIGDTNITVDADFTLVGAKALSTAISEKINGRNFSRAFATSLGSNVSADLVRVGVGGLLIKRKATIVKNGVSQMASQIKDALGIPAIEEPLSVSSIASVNIDIIFTGGSDSQASISQFGSNIPTTASIGITTASGYKSFPYTTGYELTSYSALVFFNSPNNVEIDTGNFNLNMNVIGKDNFKSN